MTGRHAVRNGMYTVSFPYEYGGMSEEETTLGEVMSAAGYATAFYGKGHLGDIEQSYMTNMGFEDEVHTIVGQCVCPGRRTHMFLATWSPHPSAGLVQGWLVATYDHHRRGCAGTRRS